MRTKKWVDGHYADYIKGHNGRGGHHSEKTKRKIGDANSKALKGKKFTKNHRQKIKKSLILIHKKKKWGFAKEGYIPWNKGKKCSFITKQKISIAKQNSIPWNKGKNGVYYASDDTKRKQRIARIKYIEELKFKGLPLMPCVGKYETQILDLIEKVHNVKVLRQHRVAGYFLDGYVPELNLAIEIDEKYHKEEKWSQRDEYRENNIKNELKCKFLRIRVDR